ncbi:queuine tRNA-ribosyltransferase accessory subunit 2 [Macrosteles quadrilineatus]|uniref:queuine tRNA-ribosyltransferase accessory subunit 2 n=1 Tax=Macrosteles quadrilineatus TaxID=74068 RepID=UPI0023E1EB10|nr:queuine tRNA-ribosyltransferase accessory subunit 2 [Macrosteles quadrilineatus]XP_054274046.1 queuine tRNA-ribosyltransferase accessory subunit 2 [Macrosteles quadrilineatus]XP_054274047.1 queuine tRNA-ribosyltransferase accessory subunit 2 [Macrosteles quadrilineatus]XP_054274048.1 queuine tRNA-ribosyltransferase accessory subunit 2 [Macrosteles quadrilineatus]
MKFTYNPVETDIPNCKMRTGKLSEFYRIPNSVFLTPLLLLYSKSGSVTHLTREVLEMVADVPSQAVQVPLSNSVKCCSSIKNFKGGISKFAGLDECLTYCSVQDPAEETRGGYNEKTSISIWTNIGRQQLSAEKYMDMMEAFKPDMYHSLCDGDTNKNSSRKRAYKTLNVTGSMFRTCAERHAQSESLKHSMLLGVVEGGYELSARRDAARKMAACPAAQGYVIDGLHNNGPSVEDISYKTIRPVINETLKHLPEDKLRIVHGGWRPDVVLDLVNAGVDVFDSSLVYLAVERGSALTFTYKVLSTREFNGVPLTNGTHHHKNEKRKAFTEPITVDKTCRKLCRNYEINLNDKRYFDDFSPISRDCGCLTCTKHTRAYIHHLLNTKEMLSSVLLMIHNLHHYLQFFRAIREHGIKGQLLTIDPPIS